MHPILFKIGPLTVYSYGVAVAAGFALASYLGYRNAARFGLDGGKIVDLLVVALVCGVLGARGLYVALNLGYYIGNPIEIADLSKGGLVWYGGFFSGLAGAAYYIRRQKLSAWNAMDLVAPYLALAQAVGRIGCFMNGCCYGAPNRPVQLYAAGWLFAIFAILCFWRERRRFDGEIFLGYCMLYGVKRFLIEFFRIDNPRILSSLTMSQLLSVLLFIAALFVFIMKANGWKRRSSH